MDSRRLELQQDLAEIDKLLSRSNREFVKHVLVQERLKVSSELKQVIESLPKPTEKVVEVTQEKSWKAIEKFSWDQTTDKVKVYVTCFKDFNLVNKENLLVESGKDSVSVSVLGYNGNDHRLKIVNLAGEVLEPQIVVKSNGFVLSMKKKELMKWKNLTGKGNLVADEEITVKSTEVDVSQELMKLYQELYRDGDEEMKKLLTPSSAGK